MQYSGRPPIHPAYISQLQGQIAEAHAELKRGIDADWRASVLRYPEVLDYFYSLVELSIPSERSPQVMEPPFAAAGYADQGYSHLRPKEVKKKKKRRDRETSAGYREEQIMTVAGRAMRGPPMAPTPPIQTSGYARPPGYPPY
jgi:hypothetical protein